MVPKFFFEEYVDEKVEEWVAQVTSMKASVKITGPPVRQVIKQAHEPPDEMEMKTLQASARREKDELLKMQCEQVRESLPSKTERAVVYVMTDANINLLHFNSCNYAHDFPITLQSLNLAPCIDKPTRVHRNSFSLIDNIFTNKEVNENIISGNIISDLSDHFSQFCLTSSLVVKGTPDRPLARDFFEIF